MIIEKEKNFVSVVVYLRNSEKYIAEFILSLCNLIHKNFINYELICVDDASSDNTADVIKSISGKMDKCVISIIRLSHYHGYESAMNAGVDLAIGDYVFEFDNPYIDYDLSLVMELYRKSLEGYDIVSASNSNYKKMSSKLFYNTFNNAVMSQYKINSETFRIVSRRAINKAYSIIKTVKFRKAVYANCGLKSICIYYDGQKHGKIKSDNNYRSETALTSLILFTNVAYRVSVIISIIMMVATILMGIYALATFALGNVVEGFTTTMLVITGSFFAVFVLFAIVIKYLSVIVQLIFNKEDYRIEYIEKISK